MKTLWECVCASPQLSKLSKHDFANVLEGGVQSRSQLFGGEGRYFGKIGWGGSPGKKLVGTGILEGV